MPQRSWYLTPTLAEKGLRYELPYQERLLRIGRELGNRLHEHDMHWWDTQLSEYTALPEWHDVPGRWEQALVDSGAKPEDYPLWLLATKSMQYHTGGNVSIALMREVAQNVRGHAGVIMNANTARRLGIADGDRVEIRSHIGATYGKAVLAHGIRPDTLVIPGQFDHWATPGRQGFRHAQPQHRGADVARTHRRHRLGRRHRARGDPPSRREHRAMTRYVMSIDLRRCVGCQTCTAACKNANATPPGVQWRRVLDLETGEFPDVRRSFLPTACMHCAEPPCAEVCPTEATQKRRDGLVTIDYDVCIGCANCVMACPYEARSIVHEPRFAYGEQPIASEAIRFDPSRISVATKCSFLQGTHRRRRGERTHPRARPRGHPGLRQLLHLGRDGLRRHRRPRQRGQPPARKNPALPHARGARHRAERLLHLGSRLMKPNRSPLPGQPAPRLQQHWDWRAAGNFICGGSGGGLVLFAGLAGLAGVEVRPQLAAGLLLVALGLLCVWFEIGRPWRALNVFRHIRSSWMTREASVALALFGAGVLALYTAHPAAQALAGLCGLAFVYAQARILAADKGIPAWRHARCAPLVLGTGLAEGAGLRPWSPRPVPAASALWPPWACWC
jgi:Fe-S-cluster-containing dehydrogenase component